MEQLYDFILDCCGRPPTAATRHLISEARRAQARRVFVPYNSLRRIELALSPPEGIGFSDGEGGLEFFYEG